MPILGVIRFPRQELLHPLLVLLVALRFGQISIILLFGEKLGEFPRLREMVQNVWRHHLCYFIPLSHRADLHPPLAALRQDYIVRVVVPHALESHVRRHNRPNHPQKRRNENVRRQAHANRRRLVQEDIFRVHQSQTDQEQRDRRGHRREARREEEPGDVVVDVPPLPGQSPGEARQEVPQRHDEGPGRHDRRDVYRVGLVVEQVLFDAVNEALLF